MSREESLLALYRKWMEFATFEHRIIRERKWKELNVHTEAKMKLMEATEKIEAREPLARGPQADELRLLIHQLADLEQLNETLLQERMSEVKVQLGDIRRNVRKVQQIRNRYEDPGSRPSGGRVSRQA
jgi:hypothetical protein